MKAATVAIARVSKPFVNGTPIGQCRTCNAVIHESERHVETPPKSMLCIGCALDTYQVRLWDLPEKAQVELLHKMETEIDYEAFYASLDPA